MALLYVKVVSSNLVLFLPLLAAMLLYTRPRIVIVGGVRAGVDNFIFTRKRLCGIGSNFVYAFIVLLINYIQSMNWIDVLVRDIFEFFASAFTRKTGSRGDFKWDSNYADMYMKNNPFIRTSKTSLHFYRRRFSIFFFAFFSTLNLSFCRLSRKTDSFPISDFFYFLVLFFNLNLF